MPANLEHSAMATGLESSVFVPIPKKANAKECYNYDTIALISYASKVMLKILHPGAHISTVSSLHITDRAPLTTLRYEQLMSQ